MRSGKSISIPKSAIRLPLRPHWCTFARASMLALGCTVTLMRMVALGESGQADAKAKAKKEEFIVAAASAGAAGAPAPTTVAIPSAPANAATPTARALLDAIRASRAHMPPFAATVEATTAAEPGVAAERKVVSMVRRRGEDFDIETITPNLPKGGKSADRRLVWNGARFYEWKRDGNYVAISQSPVPAETMLSLGSSGEILDGLFQGDLAPYYDMLGHAERAEMKVYPEMESVDGHPCRVLEAQDPELGYYKMWVDLAAGWNLRRATFRKVAGNKWLDRKLTGYRSIEHRMTEVKIGQISGRFIVTGAKVEGVTVDNQGKEMHGPVVTYERKEIKFAPDFAAMGAFAIEGQIPDGTEVVYYPDLAKDGVRHVWRHGAPVPADR